MLGSSASILSGCPVVRRSISTRASGAHSQRKATVCLVEQLLLPSDRHLGCDDYLRRTGGFMEHPYLISSVQFSHSVVSDSLRTWITARQASLSITNSRSPLRLMSIKLVMLSSHLVLCHPLFLLPPIPPSIRVFSNESTLHMRWPKYWSFSFSVISSKEHPYLINHLTVPLRLLDHEAHVSGQSIKQGACMTAL